VGMLWVCNLRFHTTTCRSGRDGIGLDFFGGRRYTQEVNRRGMGGFPYMVGGRGGVSKGGSDPLRLGKSFSTHKTMQNKNN
jgi:hypothetical protein